MSSHVLLELFLALYSSQPVEHTKPGRVNFKQTNNYSDSGWATVHKYVYIIPFLARTLH